MTDEVPVRTRLLKVRSLFPVGVPLERETTKALERSWVSNQTIIATTKIDNDLEIVKPSISIKQIYHIKTKTAL